MSALVAGYLQESMPAGETTEYADDEARWSMLMASAQSGDESSYRILLSEISDVVGRYLVSRFGQHEFIEDCVQEVLMSVHKARHTYDARRAFRPWLFAIVRHKAIDALRQGEKRQRLQLLGDTVPEIPVTGPEGELSGGEILGRLPQNLREALVLTKIVGWSGREAAQHLGISEAALKVRVHRAMGKVKKLLETQVA